MPFDTAHPRSRPVTLNNAEISQVYSLFALAMALTAVGVYIGFTIGQQLFSSGMLFFFLIVELGIIFTSGLWSKIYPLNYFLFGAFPLLSGLTITPYLQSLLSGYVNGGAILFNAVISTTFLAGGAAVFARTTSIDLGFLGRFLLFAIFGLIGFAILQIFVPTMQTGNAELLFSGAGVIIFALFIAYDVQRVQKLAKLGASPFMLALSLYLDIFNLFLFILRFMTAISGQRR